MPREKHDYEIGEKIKALRLAAGMSRMTLASKLDVSHQQLAKYENGSNKLSLTRAVQITGIFEKPVTYLFGDKNESPQYDNAHQRLCLELVKSFNKIKNPRNQKMVADLARRLATN